MFHVYVDRTATPDSRVFYVGKGNDARISKKERNTHHTNIVAKYGFVREVVFSTPSETEALQREIDLIKEHDTYVYSNTCVFGCNYTLGGDGVSGHVHATESIEKNRIAHTGVVQSLQTCEKRSISMRNSSKVKRREVIQRFDDGNIVKHDSLCAAAAAIGKPHAVSLISRCCRGRVNRAFGYRWMYVGEEKTRSVECYVRCSTSRRVEQLRDDQVVAVYKSYNAAARAIGKGTESIRACCSGKRATAYGFTWRHA